MIDLNSVPLEFSCPACGKKIKETIRWAKGKSPKCPHCGGVFNNDQFKPEIAKAEKSLADLKRTIASLGKG